MSGPPRFKPMTVALGLLLALAAALFPLLDEPYRPWNVAAFGAIGLFVAARVGLFTGAALALGSKFVFDLLNYRAHGFDADYLPMWSVYVGFAAYPLIGWWLLRRTEAAWRIGGTAVLGGAAFFLVTNFIAWREKVLPYPDTIDGLFQSYAAALPFHRGTLVGDLAFTTVLFGLHAVLSRAYFPAERVVALQPEVVR
ncbi:MAG: hypothetical protein K2P78_01865 [Gemmataceae bacterium]|nr:hypothetical protein [Gemmataceae bacterium]